MKKKIDFPEGKGVYIWQPKTIFNGEVPRIVSALVSARVDFVAIKIHEGDTVFYGLKALFAALRKAGITVGGWGYVYLKWNPTGEARAIHQAVQRYKPAFYLLDAKAHARDQHVNAGLFSASLQSLEIEVPVGLNTYYRPDLHREMPWQALLEVSDFVCPQVYWRNYQPIEKLQRSVQEYKFLTSLPIPMVAGDMYTEHGLQPTPTQVEQFLAYTRRDAQIRSVLFETMDQIAITPELWQVFAAFDWQAEPEPAAAAGSALNEFIQAASSTIEAARVQLLRFPKFYYERFSQFEKIENLSPQDGVIAAAVEWLYEKEARPLYRAVTSALPGLEVRSVRSTEGNSPLRYLPYQSTVSVWQEYFENGRMWARIEPNEAAWVASECLKKLS